MNIRKQPTYYDLKIIYDTIKKFMGDKDVFYTPDQVADLKKDTSNVFLKKENNYESK